MWSSPSEMEPGSHDKVIAGKLSPFAIRDGC